MVRDHNYVGAAIGSTLIGLCQFYIYSIIPDIEKYTLGWATFIIAGPIAIVLAMKSHNKTAHLLEKLKGDR